jgi:hypothetical protein
MVGESGTTTGAVSAAHPRYLMALAGASNTKCYFMFMLLVGIAMSELKMSH